MRDFISAINLDSNNLPKKHRVPMFASRRRATEPYLDACGKKCLLAVVSDSFYM